MKSVKESEFLALFDLTVHNAILASAARHPDCEALVCFENQQMDSSEFGRRSALVVGPSNTYTLQDVQKEGCRLGDVPSRFQYPVCFVDYRATKPKA